MPWKIHILEKACFQLQGNCRTGPTLLWSCKLAVRMTHEDPHLLTTNGVHAVCTQWLMDWGKEIKRYLWKHDQPMVELSVWREWLRNSLHLWQMCKSVLIFKFNKHTHTDMHTHNKVFFCRKENPCHIEICKNSWCTYTIIIRTPH